MSCLYVNKANKLSSALHLVKLSNAHFYTHLLDLSGFYLWLVLRKWELSTCNALLTEFV